MMTYENRKKAKDLLNKAKKNYIKGIACGIVALLLLLDVAIRILGPHYPNIDLFKRPYIANVWGTVSDWVMIIVTAITAIYLVLSFRAQKQANDISYKNYLLSIMPQFSVDFQTDNYEEQTQSYIILTQKKATASNIEFQDFNESYIYNPNEHYQSKTIYTGGVFVIPARGLEKQNIYNLSIVKVVILIFTDSEDVNYKQEIFLNQGRYWTISDPIRIA